MTQQFELGLNLNNNLDKMMNNQSQNFSNEKTNADAEKFGDFLNNANQNYSTKDSSKKFEVKREDKSYSKTQNSQTAYSDNKNVSHKEIKNDTKDDRQTTTTNSIKEDLRPKNDTNIKEEKTTSETTNVVENSGIVQEEINNVTEDLDVALKDSIINNNLMAINSVSQEDLAKLEKVLNIDIEEEVPVEALQNAISIEMPEDMQNISMDAVNLTALEEAMKNTKASTNMIGGMYNSKSPMNVIKNASDDKYKVPVFDKNDIKPEEKAMVEDVTEDTKAIVKEDTKIASDVKVDEQVMAKQDDKSPVIEAKTPEIIEEKVKDDVAIVETSFDDKIKDLSKSDLKIEVEDGVKDFVDVTTPQNVKTPMNEKVEIAKTEKFTELQEQVESAKAENIANTVETTIEDKSVSNDFAKTNVKADETMQIKDDVKGIEFNNQPNLKTADKNVTEKVVENVKEKVENVKIQVEDDVKIAPQQIIQDSAKVDKANETMQKAGLNTDTLAKMEGKITEIDTTAQNSNGGDLGQSSQEMMMRDMIQQSTNSAAGAADSKTTVEFVKDLTKATASQEIPQQQSNIPEDIDIISQISAKFAANSKAISQRIVISLTPESLGKLNIEIAQGQNGISANILADNAQAKEILDKNLDGLKNTLQSQGVNVNNVNVKVADISRSSDSNNNMFQQDSENSMNNNSNGHSQNQEDSNKDKKSEFEYFNQKVMSEMIDDDMSEIVDNSVKTEETVNLLGGMGKVSYKL